MILGVIIMPYKRQQNSIKSAIKGLLNAERLKAIPNPTEEDKLAIQQATNDACDIIENSNFITLGEGADDNIETQHQVDRVLDNAGIDRVALERAGALNNANAIVEQVGQIDNVVETPTLQIDNATPTDDIPL